jgi:hypothetical protein
MFNFLDFFKLVTDKAISSTKRTLIVLLIFISAGIINNYFGFTFNYTINQRLNHIKTICEINPSYCEGNNEIYNEVKALHLELSNREIFPVQIYKYAVVNYEKIASISKNYNKWFDDIDWLIFSSCCLFIFGMAITPFYVFKEFKEGFFTGILVLVIVEIVFYICSLIVIYLLSFIPVFEHKIFNYIINFTIQIVFLSLIGALGNKKKEANRMLNFK